MEFFRKPILIVATGAFGALFLFGFVNFVISSIWGSGFHLDIDGALPPPTEMERWWDSVARRVAFLLGALFFILKWREARQLQRERDTTLAAPPAFGG